MKPIIISLSVFILCLVNIPATRSEFDPLSGLGSGSNGDNQPVNPDSGEVHDLDDLTNGAVNTNTEKVNQNSNTNSAEDISGTALTLAECLIYEKLEIQDQRCEDLMRALNCPDYRGCLQSCNIYIDACYNDVAGLFPEQSYSNCVAKKLSCFDACSRDNSACSAKYPPTVGGTRATPLQLSAASGDVRITYEDNPRAVDMESVRNDNVIHVGAAIYTGDDGQVTITLPNGTTQWIGPGTYFRIADYVESDNAGDIRTILANGDIRVQVKHPETQKVSYVVITPLGRVHAKGTEFNLTVSADGTMRAEVREGAVEVLDAVGKALTVVSAEENLIQDVSGKLTIYKDGQEIATLQPIDDTSRGYRTTWWLGGIIAGIGVLFISGMIIIAVKIRRHKQ